MREIIIDQKDENTKIILLVENGVLLEKYEERKDYQRLEGNIYLGKVENILQGMQAAFVDIGQGKNTFIHARDIMPKIDVTKQEVKTENIKNIAKVGMPIMIQVKRDSTNKKGARVSTHISIPGRYIVLMPNTDIITISQKIENQEERNRLLEIMRQALPENTGAIIRTSAEKKDEQELKKEAEKLLKTWKKIEEEASQTSNIPKLIYQSDGVTKKLLLDMIDQNLDTIWVSNNEIKEEVNKILEEMEPKKIPEIKQEENLLDKYGLEKQIERIKQRKIWLKCGGFITIDKTEALTAIDVNSGKYIGKENLEKTVYTVNKEATEEIAKQLRLRDAEGIIIIDYIDMKSEENKQKIIEILKENLKQDRSKTQVLEFTKLNLLEMTRKHMYSNIEEK